VVSLVSEPTPSTQTAVVPVQVNAAGIENTVSFSLAFEPARLSFLSALPAPALSNLVVTLDTNQLATGLSGPASGQRERRLLPGRGTLSRRLDSPPGPGLRSAYSE
jgi:hypothetical protein